MRLLRAEWAGINSYIDPASLDLEALPAGLIALSGPIGAGKTTAMGAVAAALYGKLPSYGASRSMYDHIIGGQAYAEVELAGDGHRYRVRRVWDGSKRKSELYLWVDDAVPLDSDGGGVERKVLQVQPEIDRIFGDRAMFLASVFQAQDRDGSIVSMAPPERKRLFAEMLALARLHALAEQAGLDRRQYVGEIASVGGRLAMLEAEVEPLSAATVELATARSVGVGSVQSVADADDAHTAARQWLADLQSDAERMRQATDQAANARAQLDQFELRVSEILAAINRETEDHRQRIEPLYLDADKPVGDAAEQALDRALQRIDGRRSQLAGLLDRRPEVEAAAGQVHELTTELADAERADLAVRDAGARVTAAKAAVAGIRDALSASRAADAAHQQRLESRAALLGQAPCSDAVGWIRAGTSVPGVNHDLAGLCQLLADAREGARLLEQLPAMSADTANRAELLADAEDGLTAASKALELARQCKLSRRGATAISADLDAARALSQQLGQIEAASNDLAQLDVTEDDARTDYAAAIERAEQQRVEASAAADRERARWNGRRSELIADQADARRYRDIAKSRHELAASELAELVELVESGGDIGADVKLAESTVAATDAWLLDARQQREAALVAVARIEASVDRMTVIAAEIDPARDEINSLRSQQDDVALLESAFGPNGIQAMEIDAAGPEVSAVATELLQDAFGTGFALRLDTQASNRDGSERETFEISVYDPDRSQWRPASQFSGGQRTLISEALHIATAVFNARRSGVAWQTKFNDESATHLGASERRGYGAMLRRAVELGGFYQLVFVSHDQELLDQADAEIRIEAGRIATETPEVAA